MQHPLPNWHNLNLAEDGGLTGGSSSHGDRRDNYGCCHQSGGEPVTGNNTLNGEAVQDSNELEQKLCKSISDGQDQTLLFDERDIKNTRADPMAEEAALMGTQQDRQLWAQDGERALSATIGYGSP